MTITLEWWALPILLFAGGVVSAILAARARGGPFAGMWHAVVAIALWSSSALCLLTGWIAGHP